CRRNQKIGLVLRFLGTGRYAPLLNSCVIDLRNAFRNTHSEIRRKTMSDGSTGLVPRSASGSAPVSDVSSSQLDGMDKETRLMVLCYTMLNLLDDRMQGQMDIINARNQRATQLQGVVS